MMSSIKDSKTVSTIWSITTYMVNKLRRLLPHYNKFEGRSQKIPVATFYREELLELIMLAQMFAYTAVA